MSNEFQRLIEAHKAQGGEVEVLDQLQYANAVKGETFRLYFFGPDGYHSGGQWFRDKVKYPDEEITTAVAQLRVEAAIAGGVAHEIRIVNGGDLLVYRFKGGKQLYPDYDFWEKIGALPQAPKELDMDAVKAAARRGRIMHGGKAGTVGENLKPRPDSMPAPFFELIRGMNKNDAAKVWEWLDGDPLAIDQLISVIAPLAGAE